MFAMFDYDFMRNAFYACTIVGIVAGAVGYFLVLRGETFAGHALAHVGFPGATGAGRAEPGNPEKHVMTRAAAAAARISRKPTDSLARASVMRSAKAA